ncbi:MAG: DUF1801 domain-containing protein [Actinomycetota bacterium]|nr:DUF1801 domain-containing protein [Actinomycetota bacterium]
MNQVAARKDIEVWQVVDTAPRTDFPSLQGGYADAMPMPKRSSVDDFFTQLNDGERPHLEALRELSLDAAPEAREELKWNLPVYVRGERTNLGCF